MSAEISSSSFCMHVELAKQKQESTIAGTEINFESGTTAKFTDQSCSLMDKNMCSTP